METFEDNENSNGGSAGKQDLLSAALDECGLGDFFVGDQAIGDMGDDNSSHSVVDSNYGQQQPYYIESNPNSPLMASQQMFNYYQSPVVSPITFAQQESESIATPVYVEPTPSLTTLNTNVPTAPVSSVVNSVHNGSNIILPAQSSFVFNSGANTKKIIIKKASSNELLSNTNNVKPVGTTMASNKMITIISTTNGTNVNNAATTATAMLSNANNVVTSSNGAAGGGRKATFSVNQLAKILGGEPKILKIVSNVTQAKTSQGPTTYRLINGKTVLANSASASNVATTGQQKQSPKLVSVVATSETKPMPVSTVNSNQQPTDILASSLISSDIIPAVSQPEQQPSTPVSFLKMTQGGVLTSRPQVITVRTLHPTNVKVGNLSSFPNSTMMVTSSQQSTYQQQQPVIRVHSGSGQAQLRLGSSLLPQTTAIEIRERLEQEAQQREQDEKIMLEEVRRVMDEVGNDELANIETFNDYMPSKLKIGTRHPDQVVETASLASIPPPNIYYNLAIPDETIIDGRLSALQLESIIYASQQHETILANGERAGFLIGDGAGVGKGRTVAGIIHENYLRGRKRSLWFSVSSDLRYDAERDLHDIGAGKIEIHLLNKFKYGYKIHSPENDNVKRGVIFSTYSSLIGESNTVSGRYSTRFQQLTQWCGGEDFDGVIIFDECHKAKNLWVGSGSTRATKTGAAVLDLQKALPKARVVYASATGATEPRNMGYMTRLGIWGKGTPFEDFPSFVQTVEKRGVGAMELVAIDLKMRGMYMARQLSFKGVTFRIEHVPLSREFIRIYNCCCRLWVSAKVKFEKALELMGAEPAVGKAVWTQFWASHQRFFKYLCIASKVKFAVAYVKEALRANKSVVIGLQSTGEARTLEQLEDSGGELTDFVSTAKSVFQSLIERHFPAPNRKKLAKILGNDTRFFDELGIKLSRDGSGEIMANYVQVDEETEKRKERATRFYQEEEEDEDSDDDDFVEVSENEDDDDSDIDSDELDEIDDLMDEKLGLKKGKSSNAVKFMDILFGPSENGTKRKKNAEKRKKKKKKLKVKTKKVATGAGKKSMKGKYDKFYQDFDNVAEDVGGYCEQLRDELLEQLISFGERLPPNTLDELIDELGGPENVAEMTGRKGRVVSNEEGQVQYEARTENDVSLEMLNLVEKQRFMDDEKRVAIISEAASSGISLHADRRVKNRWRRVHLTVELPWSADRAIQQFGRTHRSNQVSAPEYVFLISNLAGEKRFASIVAKRLESLGALTHGDRRATESRDLSQFNIDTKYGRQALEIVMKLIAGAPDTNKIVPPPEDYVGDDFFEDCRIGLQGVGLLTIDRKTDVVTLDKDYGNINKFLNRILGLEVHLQNTLFRYFNETMEALIKQAKRSGRYDSGIIDLSSEVGNVQRLNEENFIMKSPSGAIMIQLHTVLIDRGINFERAQQLYRNAIEEDDWFKDDIGFYVVKSNVQVRNTIFLAVPEMNAAKNKDSVKQSFRIYKPSLGLQAKYETKTSLHQKGTKLSEMDEISKLWSEHYDLSESLCLHMVLFGKCRQAKNCDTGLRKRTYCILTGSMLTTWPELEKRIPMIAHHKLQIVRLKTDDGKKFIGPMVPPHLVDNVRATLTEMANA